jgi:hypothetical protein
MPHELVHDFDAPTAMLLAVFVAALAAASFAAALAAAIVLLARASRPGDVLLMGVAILGALSFAGLARRNGGFRTVMPPRAM